MESPDPRAAVKFSVSKNDVFVGFSFGSGSVEAVSAQGVSSAKFSVSECGEWLCRRGGRGANLLHSEGESGCEAEFIFGSWVTR